MVASKASRPRRPLPEWGTRLALAAIVSWLGYLSVTQSIALVLTNSRIETAYALAPGNSRIAARWAQAMMRPDADAADRKRAAALARQALLHDATAVEAITTLSIGALFRNDAAAAEHLLTYSQALSRRDLPTQLMALEMAVARDDIPQALRHYDIALRTKKDAPSLLYPVMASALVIPKIRDGLVHTLSSKPNWGNDFVNYVAGSKVDPAATTAFFKALQTSRFPISPVARSIVIGRLVSDKRLDDAWSYYATAYQDADRRASRDANFKIGPEMPTAFDWIAINGTGVSTTILPDARNGLFDFTVSMGNGGTLLQQLQMLPPGDYLLEGHSIGIEQPARSRPYFILRCQTGGEIGRVELHNSSQAGGRFQGTIRVPADCPVQMLALVARSSDDIGGVSGQIDRIQIRSARTAS